MESITDDIKGNIANKNSEHFNRLLRGHTFVILITFMLPTTQDYS